MTSAMTSNVREEVESLHEFFVGWFSGTLPKSGLLKVDRVG
jgi:hypothetical protein